MGGFRRVGRLIEATPRVRKANIAEEHTLQKWSVQQTVTKGFAFQYRYFR